MEQKLDYQNELSGKIALVTGGTKGAGKAIAERLKSAGAKVIITARNQPSFGEGIHTHSPIQDHCKRFTRHGDGLQLRRRCEVIQII